MAATLRYTAWIQAWYIDSGKDVRLDPDTGKLFQGKVILTRDDLVEMLRQMGHTVRSNHANRNVIGGAST